MKSKLVFLMLSVCAFGSIRAQENATAMSYGSRLTPEDLKEYLNIIASDALEGRRTGTRGQKMAAAFIADHFQSIGLQPPVDGTYFQRIELYSPTVTAAYLKIAGQQYDNLGEVYYSGSTSTGGEAAIDVVFGGRGTDDDYKQVDIKDKAVLLLTANVNGGSMATIRQLSQTARDKGARIVYLVSEGSADDIKKLVEARKARAGAGRLSSKRPDTNSPDKGVFIISQDLAGKLFKTSFEKMKLAADDVKKASLGKMKPTKASYSVTVEVSTLKTENVLGYLEGSEKKDEVILVTGHYDHIGMLSTGADKINNGADDDGSGTVTVMEIAKLFAKAKAEGHGPRRSMLFMTVTGEEEGLLGSEYYVSHPVYPLANTVVDLNIDMIGRTDPEHKDKPDYVYVIGADKLSAELNTLSEATNATYTKLDFDYTYNDENHPTNLYKRSDHWNFAKNNIPIIFYFDGIHEDYHKPSDEVSKIDFALMSKRAQCVFYTAWEIANRDARIVADKPAMK